MTVINPILLVSGGSQCFSEQKGTKVKQHPTSPPTLTTPLKKIINSGCQKTSRGLFVVALSRNVPIRGIFDGLVRFDRNRPKMLTKQNYFFL
jgi:hypothetical protein